jgi:hypothetical protein
MRVSRFAFAIVALSTILGTGALALKLTKLVIDKTAAQSFGIVALAEPEQPQPFQPSTLRQIEALRALLRSQFRRQTG